MKILYSIVKPFIFLFSPERAHHLMVKMMKIGLAIPGISYVVKKSFQPKKQIQPTNLFGLTFPNRVGLAAGFDKDGKYYDAMSNLGFGFIEIGTVTPEPQKGNEKPRLFRLPKDEAIINRMGFNNEGVDAMVTRLKNRKKSNLIIGGNIGKNKWTPNENADQDYIICFEKLFPYVDYFVVNVSSPNTPNLRDLQDKEPLTKLLNTLQKINQQKDSPKPILLKIAPDLTDDQLDDIIDIFHDTKIAGLIATNTTITRDGLSTDSHTIAEIGAGGLSGKPVQNRSTEVIQYLTTKSAGKIPIVGVGGIDSPQAAQEKLNAGAQLVQVYSSLIYKGPTLVKEIVEAID